MGDAGDGIVAEPGAWSFDAPGVAAAFDKHVALSTPEYAEVQRLVARLSTWFLVDGGFVVDWGCSTGRTIAEIAQENPSRRVSFIGVDESVGMIAKAAERLAEVPRVELRRGSLGVVGMPPPGTCLVVALYTLQFLDPAARREALRFAANGLRPGGALIVVEKVVPDDPELAGPFQDILWDEKADGGHSPAEVAAKAKSLRGILRPLSVSSFEHALDEAGFRATRFWQHLMFAGWVCVRR